ncbi:MAG: cobalamin-binding protein [Ardenticatenia bacterium]|jgi:5-methyltetrahydrofolate--homocysteine methyltransferase|nr:MAG: cobalamin-binding protein [Ardenticatenia bacterium]
MSLESIYDAVLNGDAKKAAAETEAALKAGIKAEDILHKACIPAMTEVGRLFEEGEKFVPEMLISARAMQAAMNILRPELVKADVKTLGKVVIGTVQGDLHDIGKNLVKMMLEGAGFEVIDLGVDVSAQKFVDTAREQNADIIGLSALLTTTMPGMKTTIETLKEAGLHGKIKVMIGGAPITQDYADEIGADGYAPDASSAVRKAKQLLGIAA